MTSDNFSFHFDDQQKKVENDENSNVEVKIDESSELQRSKRRYISFA